MRLLRARSRAGGCAKIANSEMANGLACPLFATRYSRISVLRTGRAHEGASMSMDGTGACRASLIALDSPSPGTERKADPASPRPAEYGAAPHPAAGAATFSPQAGGRGAGRREPGPKAVEKPWHVEAKRLRAEGFSFVAIAARLGKSPPRHTMGPGRERRARGDARTRATFASGPSGPRASSPLRAQPRDADAWAAIRLGTAAPARRALPRAAAAADPARAGDQGSGGEGVRARRDRLRRAQPHPARR